MEFLVLGPLQVYDAGRSVTIGAPRQRALLAVLLANSNRVVSTDRLLNLVWGDDPPEVGALRYQISKLRDALEPDRESGDGSVIITESPGYILRATPGQLDSLGFESLLKEAELNLPTDPAGSLASLDEALGLWRGDAYADFVYEEFARPEIVRLEERRLEAIEARFDALLALGRDRDVVGELQALVPEHPHRERLTGALMLALYRSGRQADALAAFQSLRSELGESLGIEPSKELVDLEERILLQDQSLAIEAPAPSAEYLRGYVLRGRIGEGAHGVVWRAAQPGVGREVAIKAIHPDIANRPGFVRRFEMEAQLVASLEHPHIVSLFDFWRDPEGAYLVMPHLRGGNLGQLLLQGPLQTDTGLQLVEDIGDALAYAHRRGVVHRDVTPQNVLLDDEGHPYLADFGVAALIGETGPPTSSSPAYLAPELHDGGAVPESDIYSLGVLTHSVLTGEIPMVDRPLHRVSHLNPDLPEAVDEVIARATAIDIAERFIEPNDFVAALTGALDGGRVVRSSARELRNPYKGLRAFSEADSPDFFGRDVAISELVDAVARNRLVAVVGPSGCGKSSLVRAGLLADLRQGALPGSERWLITDMYPGVRPLNELAEALIRVAVERPTDLVYRLAEGAVGDVLGGLLPCDTEMLLVVDQFEELFTLTPNEEERRRFLDVLTSLTTDPTSRARVVVTLRADFFDRPLGYAGFGELLRRGMVPIAVPSVESMEQAVVGPAESVGLRVEQGLERVITQDVADQPGGLPLLEFALTELFHERVGSDLTAAGYQRTGGVLGALGRRAEDLYVGCDDAGREAIEQVLLRLVTVEEGVEDTRRRIPLAELHEIGIEPDTLQRVLDDYGTHRLITFDRDPETRAPTVEVAHEALLTQWDRLRSWIDERRDDLVIHRRLAASVREWHDSERRGAYLLTGGRLEHYERFAEETDLALTGPEQGFLIASRQAEDDALAGRRRKRMTILGAFAAAAVIAAVLAIVAFLAQRDAEDAEAEALANEQLALDQQDLADQAAADALRQKDLAEANQAEADRNAAIARSQELAAQARVAMQEDPELAILLALEAVSHGAGDGPTKESVEALHETVNASRVRFTTPGTWRGSVSGDGDLVATRSATEPVKVIRVADGSEVLRLSITGNPDADELSELSVALSPDGVRLATGRTDGTVAMWDVATGGEVWTTKAHDHPEEDGWAHDGAHSLEFSPDGTVLASRGWDETIRLWDAVNGEQLAVLEAPLPPATLRAMDFSPDGTLLVATDGGDFTWIWDVATGDLVLEHEVLASAVDVAFTGDGGGVYIARAYSDWEIGLLDLATGEEQAVWAATGFRVAIAVSPDGSLLAAGDDVGSISTFAVTDYGLEHIETTTLHRQRIWDLAFAPGSNHLLSVGATTVRLSDLRPSGSSEWMTLRNSQWGFPSVAYSTDGTMLARAPVDDNIVVADAGTGEELVILAANAQSVSDMDFSPDGTLLAAAVTESSGLVQVWDLATGSLIAQPVTEELFLEALWLDSSSVDFSPDGRYLAATIPASADTPAALRVWRTDTFDLAFALDPAAGTYDDFKELSFTPDGSQLAVRGTFDGSDTVRFYDLDGNVLQTCCEHWWDFWTGASIEFSPDGGRMVTAGFDSDSGEGTVFVWDVTTGELVHSLEGHPFKVYDAVFNADGSLIASASEPDVRIWDGATYEEIVELNFGNSVVHEVAFSPDSSRLASTHDFEGLARVWAVEVDDLIQIAQDRLTRTFTEAECAAYDIDPCPALE